MGDDGVSDISEEVGRMVNGTGLTLESIARSGACGGGSSMGIETPIDSELWRLGVFGR